MRYKADEIVLIKIPPKENIKPLICLSMQGTRQGQNQLKVGLSKQGTLIYFGKAAKDKCTIRLLTIGFELTKVFNRFEMAQRQGVGHQFIR